MTRPHFEEQTADFARQQAAQINALQTTVDGDGWLSTLVWNTRNAYLSWPEQTFTADHMRLIVEGFLAEVERLRRGTERAGGGSVSTDIDQKRDGAHSASPLSDGPTDQPADPIGAER